MSRVYIVDPKPGMNFTEAERFGELVTVFPTGHRYGLNLREAFAHALTVAEASSPEDWILSCGGMIPNLAFSAAMMQRHGVLRVLAFHATAHVYLPQEVSV